MKIKKEVTENGKCFFSVPLVVNIQLSNYCPLSCPFCFMDLSQTSEMEIAQLKKYLDELHERGCRLVLFGQGEPMAYSNIVDAVEIAHDMGFVVNLATSGVNCNYNKVRRLKEAGLDRLIISLNSFDEEVNKKSRDGYRFAVNAIKISAALKLKFSLNYVAQKETIPYMGQYIDNAIRYGANSISVLREKVDARGNINGYDRRSLELLRDFIVNSAIPIEIEECFCELKVLLSDRTPSKMQGCAAGRAMMAITVEGMFIPCSHLQSKYEKYDTIYDYWYDSGILKKLRELELNDVPCVSCEYNKKCTTCQAIYKDEREAFHTSRKGCCLL